METMRERLETFVETIGLPKLIASALVALIAVGALGWTLRYRRVVAEDKTALKTQRAGMGIPDPDEMRARLLAELTQQLALTTEQQEKIKTILETRAQTAPTQEESSLSREQRWARRQKAQAERDARISAVLNLAQRQKYVALMEQRRARFRERPQPGGFRPGGDVNIAPRLVPGTAPPMDALHGGSL